MNVMSRHAVRPSLTARREQTRRRCHRIPWAISAVVSVRCSRSLVSLRRYRRRVRCAVSLLPQSVFIPEPTAVPSGVRRKPGAALWPELLPSTRHALPWLEVPDASAICTSILSLHAELMPVASRSSTFSGRNARQHIKFMGPGSGRVSRTPAALQLFISCTLPVSTLLGPPALCTLLTGVLSGEGCVSFSSLLSHHPRFMLRCKINKYRCLISCNHCMLSATHMKSFIPLSSLSTPCPHRL